MSGETDRNGPIRLHKLLAAAGAGSRRSCEALIADGRVRVDGIIANTPGVKAFRGSIIELDGARVHLAPLKERADHIYILLNKPVGVISSARDQFGRKTVVDIVQAGSDKRVYPVGRLDYGTSGLIILTDDGAYTYRVTHPKFGVMKTYEAVCGARPDPSALESLRNGVDLGDGVRTGPARVRTDGDDARKLTITIHEGKNRQVRRMIEAAGFSLRSLKRVAIGGLSLGGLMPGEWRELDRAEAERVFEGSGLVRR